MDHEEALLSVQGVSKHYGAVKALDETTFEVYPGEIFALLGPNGAGKTTLIGCITGLITRFQGDIRIAGKDVRRESRVTRQLVGLVPQELNFDAFFSVETLLYYHAGFYNTRPDRSRIASILKAFALYEKRSENTRSLSGGMKRRLMICKALLHDPILIFLDEPTAGVDVELREELWKYVRMLREQGATIILTTHYLEEAEQLADRIGFINNGKMLLVDHRDTIMDRYAKSWNRVKLRDEVSPSLKALLTVEGVEFSDGREFILKAHATDNTLPIHRIVLMIHEDGNEVVRVEGGRASLEQVFRELINGHYTI